MPGGVCFEESYNGSKKYSIILIIVSAVLGALLIAFPDKMIQYTALFIGGAFVACGVYAILSYIINKKYVFTLTLGIISAVAGVVVSLRLQADNNRYYLFTRPISFGGRII